MKERLKLLFSYLCKEIHKQKDGTSLWHLCQSCIQQHLPLQHRQTCLMDAQGHAKVLYSHRHLSCIPNSRSIFWMSFCQQHSHLNGYTRLYQNIAYIKLSKPSCTEAAARPSHSSSQWARSPLTHCDSHTFRLNLSEITK